MIDTEEMKTSPTDMILNKRINYYLINKIWNRVHGKSGKSVVELYQSIGLTRNSFSAILQGNAFNLESKKRKLETIGVPLEYMLGYEMISIGSIKREDWKDYFDNRYSKERKVKGQVEKKSTPEQEEIIRERKNSMDEFTERLNSYISLLDGEQDESPANLIYFYCKNEKKKETKLTLKGKLNELQEVLGRLNFSDWEKCSAEERSKAFKKLKEHYDMVRIIEQYNKLKNG